MWINILSSNGNCACSWIKNSRVVHILQCSVLRISRQNNFFAGIRLGCILLYGINNAIKIFNQINSYHWAYCYCNACLH